MASLSDKTVTMVRHICTELKDSIDHAYKTGKYQDFQLAMDQIRVAERELKAVRAHVRANMRKTKKAFQDACPHENKVDVQVRNTSTAERVVEVQACTNCSKSFDLREKVS
jgi:hypothetical protein